MVVIRWLGCTRVDGTCKGGEAQYQQHQSNHLCWLVPDHPPLLGRCRCLKFHVDCPFHAFLGDDRRGIENEAGAVVDVDDEIDPLVAEAILARRESDGGRS